MFANKKPFVFVLAAGVIIIAALLVYGILVTPVRQPYRDALTQYKNVDTALTRTNISLNAGTANDEEFAKGVTAVKAAWASLKLENEALAKEAVLAEGEGKQLYEAYSKDIQAYISYNTDVVVSMEKVRPVFLKCTVERSSLTPDATSAQAMRTCALDVQKAANVPDADYKRFAEDLTGVYGRLATIFESMQVVTDTNSAQYQELVQQWNQAVEQFSEASTTFSKNVQQQRKKILVTSSAHELKTYLEDKSRVF